MSGGGTVTQGEFSATMHLTTPTQAHQAEDETEEVSP